MYPYSLSIKSKRYESQPYDSKITTITDYPRSLQRSSLPHLYCFRDPK